METGGEYAARLDGALRRTASRPCILCGGKAAYGGIFAPDNPQEYGAAPGKGRLIFYSFCAHCQQEEDRLERVQKIILYQTQNGETTVAKEEVTRER
jgi:hypothetical protein